MPKLRKDGCCFVNLGDVYMNSPSGGSSPVGNRRGRNAGKRLPKPHIKGVKPKDLILIPF
jgi:hypothetical protein